MLVIVDYGMGNVGSIQNMLKKIGHSSLVSGNPEDILAATKLILPGVGAFDQGMKSLADKGLIEPLRIAITQKKVPVLGICLGMQLLGQSSEEGQLPGLGWVDARAVRFVPPVEASVAIKVPHMGWNVVHPVCDDIIFTDFRKEARFYFVHSYHMVCGSRDIVIGETIYGARFASMFRQCHIFGVQFHPEKSHRFGIQLLKNFVESI